MAKRKEEVQKAVMNTFDESLLEKTVEEKKAMKSSGGEVGVLIEFNKGACVMHDDNSSKSPDGKDIAITKEEPMLSTTERSSMETNSEDSSPIQKNQEDQLIISAKAKMGEVREDNERLKLLLAQITKDYQSLKMQFFDILQQGEAKKSINTAPTPQENEEPEFVSLSLGRTSSEPKKDVKKNSDLGNNKEDKELKGGLALELDCKFEPNSTEPVKKSSSKNSFEDLKEDEPTEIWPPSKFLKTMRSGDEELLQQIPLKKARVSVRARCDTQTMNDGCQWRKYGQKIAKGNPCPRAYYRCTVSPTCPVRKQVQRCAEDMSILTTTYEGNHNHPLPISATAMASTTSAAVSMLQSQSSSSKPGLGSSLTAPNSTSTTVNLQGLNFTLSQNTRQEQFYFPNSSYSTSNSHPTITLDLTTPTTSNPFNRFSYAPRSSSTCLNFSPSLISSSESNPLQTSWNSGHPNYGILSYNRNHTIGSLNLGRQPAQEQIYQPYMPMNNQTSSQQPLTETIAAATKVIASNPNFRSALAAALTSFVGNGAGGGGARENRGGGESSSLSLERGESLSMNSAYPITQNGVGCASSYLNQSSSMNIEQQQQGSLILFPTSFPLSKSKSSSGSPTENRDQIK